MLGTMALMNAMQPSAPPPPNPAIAAGSMAQPGLQAQTAKAQAGLPGAAYDSTLLTQPGQYNSAPATTGVKQTVGA